MKFGIRVKMLMFLLYHDIWVKRQREIHSKHEVRNSSEDANVLVGSRHLGQAPTGNPFSPDLSGAKQSPPVQVMGKSDDEDPNRIPSSIFQRTNTATPMEWSVASNESLFSIHMGNSSFSKDQDFLVGKSQELSFPNSPLNATPPLTPSAASRPSNLRQPGAAEAANAEAMNAVIRAAAEGCSDKERTSAEVEPRSTTKHIMTFRWKCLFFCISNIVRRRKIRIY